MTPWQKPYSLLSICQGVYILWSRDPDIYIIQVVSGGVYLYYNLLASTLVRSLLSRLEIRLLFTF